MRKPAALVAIMVCVTLCVGAQTPLSTLQVRVVLIDKDLNQKPVPKLTVTLRALDGAAGSPFTLKTGLDGRGEAEIPSGRYLLSTPQPVDFQGKQYSWELELAVTQPEQTMELSNDNAKVSEGKPEPPTRSMDELAFLFKRYQNSVVTVWSEIGHGTGFIVDPKGLVLTNQHVVGASEYIAVQFDDRRKLPAVLLSADPRKDVAVLWFNTSAIPDVQIAPIRKPKDNQAAVVEGERVFTIGSPLSQRKILTTGIVSKVEPRAIISDININPGNSGGPLFNSLGVVVGITTFGEHAEAGPGISGIIRIEEAVPLIDQAREKTASARSPASTLLLVEPTDTFPLDAIKSALEEENFKTRPYMFSVGDYEVALITPILHYHLSAGSSVAAAKEKEKRNKKKPEAVKGTFRPTDDLKQWQEYAGQYKPILLVRASPKLRETTGSLFTRALVGPYARAKIRFKTDFYKMRIICSGKEITPIHPGKIATVIDVQSGFINATDATYQGLYSYPFDAVSPECGQVTLELYSEKNPNQPTVKVLDSDTVERLWADFAPYRKMHAASKP